MKYLTEVEHKILQSLAPNDPYQWFNFITNEIYMCHICDNKINNLQDNLNDHGFKHLKLKAFI